MCCQHVEGLHCQLLATGLMDLWMIFEELVGLVSQTPATHSVFLHIPTPSHEMLVLMSSACAVIGFVKGSIIPILTVKSHAKVITIIFSKNILTTIILEQSHSIIGLV